MSESNNYFTKLSAINVADHMEKKGQFSYLSWPFAVSQLRQCDPRQLGRSNASMACLT
jgi:hypothetical protein